MYQPNSSGGPPQPRPVSTADIQPALIMAAFVPTLFGIIFLSMADDNKDYGDKEGLSGGLSGLICLLMALSHSVAVHSKSVDLCHVMILSRLCLAVIAVLMAIGLSISIGTKVMAFTCAYFIYALFAVPESFLLYTYAGALTYELYPEKLPQPPHPAGPPHPPTWAGSHGDFGIA